MEKEIKVSESTFSRLSAMASGFQTPDEVLKRLLDFHDEKRYNLPKGSIKPAKPKLVLKDLERIDPDNPPNLTGTQILRGSFAEKSIKNWKNLIGAAHTYALAKLGSVDKLIETSQADIAPTLLGVHGTHWFKRFPELGLSIRCPDSNRVWSDSLFLAKFCKVRIWGAIEWRRSKRSQFPGRRGLIVWEPDHDKSFTESLTPRRSKWD